MENQFLVKFNKPYKFEGQEYTEVDLCGIEDLTTKDIIEAEKQFASTGQVSAMNEMTVGYACIIAAKVSGKPDTFFDGLPGNEGVKIKNIVMGFFLS